MVQFILLKPNLQTCPSLTLLCGLRGMAVRDSSAKHGLKLAIEDYPYAADGLEIWDALKEYMTDHVKIFYKNDKSVAEDTEHSSVVD